MGRASTKEALVDRRQQALELRLAGCHHRQIAKKLGVAPATAYADVEVMMAELADKHTAESVRLRSLQTRRYELLLNKIWDRATGGELSAVDRAVAILSRIDRINALDDGKSLAVWVQAQHRELTVNLQPPVQVEILEEYATIIHQIVAAQDATAADTLAEFQAGNGHRESFKV